MDSKEFVANCKKEKDRQMKSYLSGDGNTQVSTFMNELKLSDSQSKTMEQLLDCVLTDTYYTLLLGLDGSTGIGDMQHTFKMYDEDGNLISDCGELESEAYEQFQAPNK